MYISCIDGGGDDDDAMLQEEADGSALLPAPARTMCAVHLDFKEIALFLPASSNRHDGVVVSLPSAEAEFWATEVDRNENASDWKCTAVVSALECSTRAPVAVTRTTRSCAGGGVDGGAGGAGGQEQENSTQTGAAAYAVTVAMAFTGRPLR